MIVCKTNKINKPKRETGLPWWLSDNLSARQESQETQVQSLGQEDPLKKGTATQASILGWRIPWLEKPDVLQSKGCKESDTTEAS